MFTMFKVADSRQLLKYQAGLMSKQVSLAFGDQIVMCLYDKDKSSSIRLYYMVANIKGDKPKELLEINA